MWTQPCPLIELCTWNLRWLASFWGRWGVNSLPVRMGTSFSYMVCKGRASIPGSPLLTCLRSAARRVVASNIALYRTFLWRAIIQAVCAWESSQEKGMMQSRCTKSDNAETVCMKALPEGPRMRLVVSEWLFKTHLMTAPCVNDRVKDLLCQDGCLKRTWWQLLAWTTA